MDFDGFPVVVVVLLGVSAELRDLGRVVVVVEEAVVDFGRVVVVVLVGVDFDFEVEPPDFIVVVVVVELLAAGFVVVVVDVDLVVDFVVGL